MDKPDLYNQANAPARNAAKYSLSKYAAKINWKTNGGSVIDLGCGDGSVTNILKEYIPSSYDKFFVTDINEKMIQYAAEHYGDDRMMFKVLDVEGQIPDELRCEFDQAFAFHVFHFVRNQEKAFRNVYELLKDGGDCFVTMFSDCVIYQTYELLSKEPKWGSSWLKDPNVFISPYYNMKDKEKYITRLLKDIGFKDIVVDCQTLTNMVANGKMMKDLLSSVDPYGMPPDVLEEFTRDFLITGQQLGFINKTTAIDMADVHEPIQFDICLIMVYAKK